VHGARAVRVAVAALVTVFAVSFSSVADAATSCAWKGQTPCLAKRSPSSFFWGASTTANPSTDVSVNAEGFGLFDLSDLAVGPDLSGTWTLNGQPAALTPADGTNAAYNGESGGALFALTITGTKACITGYSYAPVPNNATSFTCGTLAADLKTIGPLVWSSPVWGTGTLTFTR
jgi:hypothetical protein